MISGNLCKKCKEQSGHFRREGAEVDDDDDDNDDDDDDNDVRLTGTEAEDFKDVDPHHHKVKNKWKKTHTNMISAIKEAKKNRPPTAMANIDVKIVT